MEIEEELEQQAGQAAAQGAVATEDGDPEYARAMMDIDGFDNGAPAETGAAEGETEDKGRRAESEDKAGKTESEDEAGKVESEDKAGKVESEDKAGKTESEDEAGRKLSPEAQAAVDRRIGKEVARRKEVEELLDGERALNRELKERLDATARAETSDLMLADTEEELQRREDWLWRVVEWCEDNADGYEGDGTEKNPPYTAEEIRDRLRAARKELRGELPRARTALTKRLRADDEAAKEYPDLARPDSALAAEVDAALRLMPFMKAAPDCRLLLADMAEGRRIRASRNASRNAPAAKGEVGASPKPRPPRAPAAPGAPTATGAPATAGRAADGGDPDAKYARGGYDDESLADAFMEE